MRFLIAGLIWASLGAGALLANDDVAIGPTIRDWPPRSIPGALLTSVLFGVTGILLAVLGFKLFDWCTPGNLQKEAIQNNNVGASVVSAAIILGICIILAAAIH